MLHHKSFIAHRVHPRGAGVVNVHDADNLLILHIYIYTWLILEHTACDNFYFFWDSYRMSVLQDVTIYWLLLWMQDIAATADST
jgi:hypothetical protein